MICPATPCDIVTGTHCRTLIDNLLESKRTVVAHLHLTFLTSLCSNEHYTIGTAATIDSGRGSILKDVDALDVTRVQRLDTSRLEGHTIYNIERSFTSRYRTGTTNHDASDCTWALTCCDIHTGSLTLQSLEGIVHRLGIQFLLTHTRQSTGYVALALYTITYYHHLVEQLLVLFESNVELTLACYSNSLIAITYIRNYEACIFGNILNGKITVEVGNCTRRGSLYNDTGTDDWLTSSVNHSS